MNRETNKKTIAKQSLLLTMSLTVIIAIFEVIQACKNYRDGMNIFDLCSFATANMTVYCLMLILINLIMFPMAVTFYKESGISLKDEIFSKGTLGRDVVYGIIGAVISSLLSLLSLFVQGNRTDMAFEGISKQTPSLVVLEIISLVLVSGFCKEIYFRGFAKNFSSDIFGETGALLLFNILFGLLDWFNMGHSFVAGLVWIITYKKTKHLIAPMIAHGGMNLIAIIYYIVMQNI